MARGLKFVVAVLTSQRSLARAGIEPTVTYEDRSEQCEHISDNAIVQTQPMTAGSFGHTVIFVLPGGAPGYWTKARIRPVLVFTQGVP